MTRRGGPCTPTRSRTTLRSPRRDNIQLRKQRRNFNFRHERWGFRPRGSPGGSPSSVRLCYVLIRTTPRRCFPSPRVSRVPTTCPTRYLPYKAAPSPRIRASQRTSQGCRIPIRVRTPSVRRLLSPNPLRGNVVRRTICRAPSAPILAMCCGPSSTLSTRLSMLQSP